MNASLQPDSYSLTLVCVASACPETYSLEAAARMGGIHPEMLRHYCQIGLFGEEMSKPGATPTFDDAAICDLRRYERRRRFEGMNRSTLRLIGQLTREIDRLQAEVRFLRGT